MPETITKEVAVSAPVAPEMINLTIDGKKVTVEKGTLVITAAFQAGADVPYFCHHPRLTPAGACRMCLVKIEKMNKMQTACTVPVAEGMVVDTTSPEVSSAQKAMLEFLLINHPLDCPICDRGGECPLQNMTFQYGPGVTRFIDEKRHFPKPIPISNHVVLDRERCIQCARCTRFTEEIAGDSELAIESRGNTSVISPFSATGLNSKFSGNTVELCPVGALLSRTYRFSARPWEIHSQNSICSMCGVGCNIAVQTRRDELIRINARENDAVNEEWTCDTGKFEQYWVTSKERLQTPFINRSGRMMPASWDEALAVVADTFKKAAGTDGVAVAGIAGTHLSNEDAYLFQKLFRVGLGSNNIDHRLRPIPMHPMQSTIAEIGSAKRIIAIGFDPKEYLPVLWLWIYKAISKRGAAYIAVGSQNDKAVADAISAGEGTIILAPHTIGIDGAKSLIDQAAGSGAKVNILLPDSNSWGLINMGVLPDRLPAQQLVTNGARPKFEMLWGGPVPENAGLDVAGMLESSVSGKLKALYVVGSNVAKTHSETEATVSALTKVPFLVVQDMFMTETAKLADVVLPSCSFIEKNGHFTNIEGRVQPFYKAIDPMGQSKPDWQVFAELLARYGKPVAYFDAPDITTEIALATAH